MDEQKTEDDINIVILLIILRRELIASLLVATRFINM